MKRIEEINLKKGLQSDQINDNFIALQEQIDEERITSSGYGISNGIDFIVTNGNIYTRWYDFDITITDGIIINKIGQNILVNPKKILIEKPKLTEFSESVVVNGNSIITLSYMPYSTSRLCPSCYDITANHGITLIDKKNGESIEYLYIKDNQVKLATTKYNDLEIEVKYNITSKRIDTIYIDKHQQLDLIEGITSQSASPKEAIPENNGVICTILVDPFIKNASVDSSGELQYTYKAGLSLYEDLREKRPIYVDKNSLYLYGEPYKEIQNIKLTKPVNPQVDKSFWYDHDRNKLLFYKMVDEKPTWVPVNDDSLVPVYETKTFKEDDPIWSTTGCNNKTFVFDINRDRNMLFIPNTNCVDVIINNIPLHTSQFQEIVVDDKDILDAGKGENVGIGIKLAERLDSPAFVEIRVKHSVKTSLLPTRFQRSSTFIKEDYVILGSEKNVTLKDEYIYGESQLELFLNGRRLTNNIDYIEIKNGDNKCTSNVKLYDSLQFKTGDILSYKISINVYSYDNIDAYFSNISKEIDTAKKDMEKFKRELLEDVEKKIGKTISTVCDNTAAITKHEEILKKALTTDSKIEINNFSSSLANSIPKGLFNSTVTVGSGNVIQSNSISPTIDVKDTDFIQLYNLSSSKPILVKDTDYSILKTSSGFQINILNNAVMSQGNKILIVGIKF